jgi:hypothetical protein
MDLVRLILLNLEGESEVDLSDFTLEQINYHEVLLIQKNFVRGDIRISPFTQKQDALVYELTWDGHSLLEAIKDTDDWQIIKQLQSKRLKVNDINKVNFSDIEGSVQIAGDVVARDKVSNTNYFIVIEKSVWEFLSKIK